MRRPTERDLERFADWLREYNKSDGTIDLYVTDVRRAWAASGGPLSRLRDRQLAPKTRRHILAALRAYAEYAEDGELLVALKKIKLPPARRVSPRPPMTSEQWYALQDTIDTAELAEPMRAVLGIMAVRGLRCGDVLRLTPREVRAALETGTLTYQAKGERWIEYTAAPIAKYLELLANERGWKRVSDLISPKAVDRPKAAHRAVMRHLRRCAARAGCDGHVHPHRLRRTYAVHFYGECGGDLVALQEHMQWASLETARGYVDHSRREQLDKIAEKMRRRRRRTRRPSATSGP